MPEAARLMNAEVVGIGVCTLDFLVTVPQMPEYGGVVYADNYLRQSGGLVATALVTLARLGVATQMIGRIGDDEEGDFIRRELEQEGVATHRLLSEPGTVSHISIVMVENQSAERSFISRWASGSPLQVADLSREEITAAQILFIDNINEVTHQAAQWARDAGVWVVLDPVKPFDEIKALLPLVDVPIVPERFAKRWMPDATPETVVEELYKFGAKIAVLTLGERGCVVCSEQGVMKFPALPVDVVDTTGAGDAFHGGFMYGLLQGWDVAQIARFASAVGAMNCRFLGGRTGLPTLAEVEQFLADHPVE